MHPARPEAAESLASHSQDSGSAGIEQTGQTHATYPEFFELSAMSLGDLTLLKYPDSWTLNVLEPPFMDSN